MKWYIEDNGEVLREGDALLDNALARIVCLSKSPQKWSIMLLYWQVTRSELPRPSHDEQLQEARE